MTRLDWRVLGQRYFETGVDRGVLYIDDTGIAWNGLVSVSETPSGGEPRPYYIDGYKFLNIASAEEYVASIQAYSSPSEFDTCDGTKPIHNGLFATNQTRKHFGFSYRTRVGNEVEGADHGYKLHIVYNALASPTTRNYATISETGMALEFSWGVTTTQEQITGLKPTAHLVIDSRNTDSLLLSHVEDILYGTVEDPPRLITPNDLVTLFGDGVDLSIELVGDGTFIASGWDVFDVSPGIFSIDNDAVTDNGDGTFTIVY